MEGWETVRIGLELENGIEDLIFDFQTFHFAPEEFVLFQKRAVLGLKTVDGTAFVIDRISQIDLRQQKEESNGYGYDDHREKLPIGRAIVPGFDHSIGQLALLFRGRARSLTLLLFSRASSLFFGDLLLRHSLDSLNLKHRNFALRLLGLAATSSEVALRGFLLKGAPSS